MQYIQTDEEQAYKLHVKEFKVHMAKSQENFDPDLTTRILQSLNDPLIEEPEIEEVTEREPSCFSRCFSFFFCAKKETPVYTVEFQRKSMP